MRKTVLHILNTGSYSGAENVAISIICGLREQKGDAFRFVYVSLDGPIRQILQEKDIEFAPVEKLKRSELKRVIREYHPDLLHAHDFTASVVCAAALSGIPVISHIHNNTPWIGTYCIRSFVYGISCLCYEKMLGVSGPVFEEFVFGKYFREKQEIIGNPLNAAEIRERAGSAKECGAYDVVFLGRLSAQKNPFLFLEIMRNVCQKRPVKAVMIGAGELRGEVEKRIREYGLEKAVTLTGFLANPYGILANSKMLCLPSLWEGYGLVAAEALALGKPVIAAPVGGIPSILQGQEGRLCNTKEEYVEEILAMLDDTELYRMRVKAAGQRAVQLDNSREYIEKIGQIYFCQKG